jgi:hypothetical protein
MMKGPNTVLLSADSATRQKGTHPLHSMVSTPSRQLMEILEFNTKFYPVWSDRKVAVQSAKGGGGAYAEECRRAVKDYVQKSVASGSLALTDLEPFISSGEFVHDASRLGWQTRPASLREEETSDFAVSRWEIKCREQAREIKQLHERMQAAKAAAQKTAESYELIIASLSRLVGSLHQGGSATQSQIC